MSRHTHLQLNLDRGQVEMLKVALGKFQAVEFLTDDQYFSLLELLRTVNHWLATHEGDSNGRAK